MTNNSKTAIKKVFETICISMVKIAKGSASANFTYQPKEPKELKTLEPYFNGKH